MLLSMEFIVSKLISIYSISFNSPATIEKGVLIFKFIGLDSLNLREINYLIPS